MEFGLDRPRTCLQRVRILLERPNRCLEFFTGYLIEKTLDVDNIFVFVLVFSFFKIPEEYQHRVLFWGILGALIMRGFFIAASADLIVQFHWIVCVLVRS